MSFLVQPGLIRNAKMSVAKGFRGKKGVDGNPVLPDRTVLVAEPRDELVCRAPFIRIEAVLNQKFFNTLTSFESMLTCSLA